MSSQVEQIKERLSVVDVLSSYLTLERAGANYKARCPFHNEKTPSFFISPVRESYYCFGCGAKGDIFTFVQEFEGLDFVGALKILAERAGVPLTYEKPENKDKRERLYECMEMATRFYETELVKSEPAQKYLAERGISKETIKLFRIGYALSEWRELFNYLKGKKFSDAEIEAAGLSKKPDGGVSSPYDRFRGRIMFPIADSSGRIIAFSGRIFPDDGKSAKYLNSPETELFNKSSVFYGLDKAKLEIKKRNFAILVEGQIDLVMLHQYGFTNAIASSGTAVTEDLKTEDKGVTNLGVIKRLTNNLLLGFDADSAGIRAASRTARIALGLGMDVKIVRLPEGLDPADALLKDKNTWIEAQKKAVHVIPFLMNILTERVTDSLSAGRAVREKILPFVSLIPSTIDQSHFINLIHQSSGIPEEALLEDLKRMKKADVPAQIGTDAVQKKNNLDERIFGILYWQSKIADPALDIPKTTQKLKQMLSPEIYDERERSYHSRTDELVFEAEILYDNSPPLRKIFDELCSNLEEKIVREKLFILQSKLRDIKENDVMQDSILKECTALSKRLEEIKKSRFI